MLFRSLAVAVGTLAAIASASAQTYPTRPITFVIASAATGASTDLVGRYLAKSLEPRIGQSIIVENKPGAGSYIGNEYVTRAAPDGYTLLINAMAGLHSNIFVKGQPIDPSAELIPVAPIVDAPVFLTVPAQLNTPDLKSFMALVKANPMKYNLTTSLGSALYLDTMTFLKEYDLPMTVIPYSSFAAVMPAMGRNEYHLFMGSLSSFKNFLDQGTVKAIAVASERRLPALPDVPTAKEQGVRFVNASDFMVFAPPKTPPEIVKKLNDVILATMKDPEVIGFYEKLGFIHTPATPAELAQRQAAQHKALVAAADAAGIKPE